MLSDIDNVKMTSGYFNQNKEKAWRGNLPSRRLLY